MFRQFDVNRLVTVFGGSGFVGRHLVRALCKRGYRIRVAVRRPDLIGHLQPLGRVGQIHAVQANLRHAGSVEAALRDADAVVNLVGIMHETRAPAIHGGAGAWRGACRARRREARHSARAYVGDRRRCELRLALCRQAKAEGERLVLAAKPDAVIMRPSIIFGPEDSFFNRFASMARISPALPLIGGGATRFQPVFAGDVALAFADAVERQGQARHDLRTGRAGGPQLQGTDAIDARHHRAQAPAGADPLPDRQAASRLPRPLAQPAADHRPGRAAQERHCGVGSGYPRAAHAGRPRHQADADGSGVAVLPLALSQGRPVQQRLRLYNRATARPIPTRRR